MAFGTRSARGIAAAALGAVLLGGCAIDVDLSSTPQAALVGQPITFDISVRNRTNCPVGEVIALLVPFVPKDLFINQIADPDLREELSAFLDAFCSGQDVEAPDGSGGCRIENGELICELFPPDTVPQLPAAAIASTTGGDIVCASDGTKITCRFPKALVTQAQQASQQASPGNLDCVAGSNFAICAAALLDPNETKSAQVQIDVPYPGILRNFVVSVPDVDGGVCTGSPPNVPCNEDLDCAMGNVCATGICTGDIGAGQGCNDVADCVGGTCEPCEVPDDGQLLSGIACTTTAATATSAPTMSQWGLAAVFAMLSIVAAGAIRRLRRLG